MNYLFNGNDINLINVGVAGSFFHDFVNHVFTAPNFTKEDKLSISLYLVKDDDDVEVEEWHIKGDLERKAFFNKVSLFVITGCVGVIIDIFNGANRMVYTFQNGILKKLLLSVGVADSLFFTSKDIHVIPELKISLLRSWHLHVATRDFPYTHQLNNVHPFQIESFIILRGLIQNKFDMDTASLWYRRHLLYCQQMRSLLSKIDAAHDFINMNPHLLDQYENNVEEVITLNQLKTHLLPDAQKDVFFSNLKHYMAEYDHIIDRGLKNIEETR